MALGLGLALVVAARVLTWYPCDVELPASSRGRWVDTSDWPRIEFSHRGEIRYEGAVVTLNELGQALPEAAADCLLCVDRRAPAAHLAWLLHEVTGLISDPRRVHFAVAGRSVVPANERPDGEPPHHSFYVNLDLIVGPGGEVGFYHGVKDVDAMLREIARAEDVVGAIWLTPEASVPFADQIAAHDRARRAGIRYISWAELRTHDVVAALSPLPAIDPERHTLHMGLSQLDLQCFPLPLAPRALPDRDDDPDDRLIINLDRHGVLYRAVHRSLDELGTIVAQAKREYSLRQKMKGKSGMESAPRVSWTRLFALLRVDKDTPFRHVQLALLVLDEERLFKVQFAAEIEPEIRHSPEECSAVGVLPTRRVPMWLGVLPGKLPFHDPFLPEDAPTRVVVDGGVYRLGSTATSKPVEIARLVRGPVIVDATPDTAWKHVVALLEHLGSEDVAFTRPPPLTRDERTARYLAEPPPGVVPEMPDKLDPVEPLEPR
ncbi:MAG: hypothetical protein ACYTGN_01560 [Planctomycetota bacterium]